MELKWWWLRMELFRISRFVSFRPPSPPPHRFPGGVNEYLPHPVLSPAIRLNWKLGLPLSSEQ